MPFFGNGGGDYKLLIGNNVKGGARSLALVTGTGNVGLNSGALQNITTGHDNLCVGVDAGKFITTGANNLIVGNRSSTHVGPTTTDSVLIGNDILSSSLSFTAFDVIIGNRSGNNAQG